MVEVQMMDLIPEQHYVVVCAGFDENEEPVKFTDVVWIDLSPVVGQGKKAVRQIRFCRFPKVLVFSQVVGCKFYGPLVFEGLTEVAQVVKSVPVLPGSALAKFFEGAK